MSLGQYLRHYKKVKVGITADPERRIDEYCRRTRYRRMVVIYTTQSVNNANKLEKWFINNRGEDLENIWKGKSNSTSQGPYYVYFVMYGKI